MGIDSLWVKVFIHIFKDNSLLNLPRVIWVNKNWTLKELHLRFFAYVRDLFVRWYKEVQEKGTSEKSRLKPQYKSPVNGEILNYESFMALSLEQQFEALFPALNEQNWQTALSQ